MYAEWVRRKGKTSPETDATSTLEPVRRLQALSGEMQVSQMRRSMASSGALPRPIYPNQVAIQ